MLNKWNFGRQISYRPLITSVVIALALMLISTPLFSNVGFGYALVVGVVVFLFVAVISFPAHLAVQYGFWQVTPKGISYYNYASWQDRVHAIFRPRAVQQNLVQFDQIQTVTVVVGHKIIESKEIIGPMYMVAYAPEFYLPWMRTARYLDLKLSNGEEVHLDLSWNYQKHDKPDKYLSEMMSYLEAKRAGSFN